MHIKTLADTSTITVPVCPRCGTIDKSGIISCCGRRGSWFKNCGSADSTKLHHTWHEGILACKARSQPKTVIGQQPKVAREKNIYPSQGADIAHYKAVIIEATKTFAFTSAIISPPTSDTTSIATSTYTPDNVSMTTGNPSTLVHTLMTVTRTHTSMTSSTHTSVSTRGHVNPWDIAVHINVLLIFAFYE